MNNQTSAFKAEELVNHVGEEYLNYVNLENMTIGVYPSGMQETDTLLRIPYEEELTDYNVVMGDYLSERDVCIPLGESATCILKRQKLIYDFWEFRNKANEKALKQWFLDNQIYLAPSDKEVP